MGTRSFQALKALCRIVGEIVKVVVAQMVLFGKLISDRFLLKRKGIMAYFLLLADTAFDALKVNSLG